MSVAAQELAHAEADNPSLAEMRRVFALQSEHALRLRASTAAERIAKLRKLRDALVARKEAVYLACEADFRKPRAEVDFSELMPVFAELRHTERHLRKWMKPKRVMPTSLLFGTRTYVRPEPKGVSLIISPWNYPVNLTFTPLVSAIAAGCPAILKPSEMTPNLSRLLGEMVRDTFDERDVALFEGDVEASQALLEMPFDHIFFTGSPAVGKIVMAAAAKHLSSVTLELGGKSPTIVDENADLERAAKSIIFGKFTNVGQTCIAPDHVYVHHKVKDRFAQLCSERLKISYGDDAATSPHYARMVNSRHTLRVKSLVDEATGQGAKVLHGGDSREDDNYVAPTLMTDLPDDSRIMQEEIFGPVLPLVPFTELSEVIDRINAAPKPLALYYYGRDSDRAEQVISNTSSGGACINQCVVQYLHMNAPFGGVNNSGIGNSHGLWGFKAFSHERTTVVNKFSMSHWMAPPYTDFVKRLIATALRTSI